MKRGKKLPRSFYARDAVEVAPELIGLHLVLRVNGERRVGRIVETEAYQGPEDWAAHSARGRRTARTEVMFGAPGHAYVYFIYGFWHCLNFVTQAEGTPHAVLVRALEPLANVHASTHGPGLLCRALGVDRAMNGWDLTKSELWLEEPALPRAPQRVEVSPRIGVDYAGEWAARPWRFFDADSPFVSTKSASARKRLLEARSGETEPEPPSDKPPRRGR